VSASNSSVTQYSVHPGVYKDSLVLMQLQHRLLARPGVLEAGAAMASPANLELLGAGGLLPDSLPSLQAEDLLVIVRAEDDARAGAALDSVEELLAARHTGGPQSFRPRSLDGALSQLPESRWVLVSVPGSYAARVTEDSLDRGLNVFLYSDNVSGADEDRLKSLAAQKGLMVLGPDCGTAIVAGTGLGFANHVRRGSIGLVGGSGTGLQAVSVAIHQLGEGVSQAIGTGGHEKSAVPPLARASACLPMIRPPGSSA
jgi:FdrA protein